MVILYRLKIEKIGIISLMSLKSTPQSAQEHTFYVKKITFTGEGAPPPHTFLHPPLDLRVRGTEPPP